jgi:hypothetical protein
MDAGTNPTPDAATPADGGAPDAVSTGNDAALPPDAGGGSPCIELGCTVLATFTGEAAGDTFGWVAADLGDLDGDGVHEFAIGAPFNGVGGANAGRAYVYNGKTFALMYALTGEPQSTLAFGIAAAGDVDGDGVGDIVLGAIQSGNAHANLGNGFARVYSGKTGAHIRTIGGAALNDAAGFSVGSAGDVDKDGHADLLVASPYADSNGVDSGRVLIVSGATGATLFTFDGEAAGDLLGTAAAGVGDVNKDGVPDVLIGARNAGSSQRGRAYVRSGKDGKVVYTFDADATGADLGWFFAATPGDVNKDGVPDLFSTDFDDDTDDAGAYATGRAYVWSGADGSLLLDLPGRVADEGFGIGRARVGDVDHDGYDDLIVGAWTNSSGAPSAGRTYVISGKTGKDLRTITSSVANENSGYDAMGIGDVNGDGAVDFLITAASNGALGPSTGRAYVIAGTP